MKGVLRKWGQYDFSPEKQEILLWPRAKAELLLKEKFAQGPTQKILKEKLKGLDKNEANKDRVFPKKISNEITLHYSEGGSTHILLLEYGAPIFEIQKTLAKSFGEELKNSETSILRVQHFDSAENSALVSFVLSLAQLVEWKPTYFGLKAPGSDKNRVLEIYSEGPFSEAEMHRSLAIADATSLVRTLADLPGNELNPRKYRERIQSFAKEKKLAFNFLDCAALKKIGAGAFLAVAQGESPQEKARSSGIARLSYKGPKAKKKIVLVGKGLCFDTGGYNIKTGPHMFGMEKDMTGSAIALALIGLIADLKLPLEVEAILAITENLISPEAFRPNDVVQALDGTTIEVVDTDAEGRMVLADALALARKEKAALTLDFATLTGASIRAIDTMRSTVFSNQKSLLNVAVEAGDRSGERVWPFPIGDDYFEALKSDIADIRQLAAHNNADHIYAATFLSHFIGAETPWIHLDLAAANNKGGLGLVTTETTGFGVRWALEIIESHVL